MASRLGENIKVQIFGQSHAKGVGVVIDGLPAGIRISEEEILDFLKRRAGGQGSYTTSRTECDLPIVYGGLIDGVTCGAPLCAVFENQNTRSEDYRETCSVPRPSHADYVAQMKYHGFADMSGGGQFSGRLTLPLCYAGAVCKQILKQMGVEIGAHIYSVGGICDEPYDAVHLTPETLYTAGFPVISEARGAQMIELMERTAAEADSVGGVIECGIIGMPVGIGEPIFDNLESRISYGMFGIPAVKGIEFGSGFAVAGMKGSECNDAFYLKDKEVQTKTNHSGGIQGGISNGMPIVFRIAVKPTPSIGVAQQSVDLEKMQEVSLKIHGRHDACIVPRAVPCVEAVAAIVMLDMMNGGNDGRS